MLQQVGISRGFYRTVSPVITLLAFVAAAWGDDGRWIDVRDGEGTRYLLDKQSIISSSGSIRTSRVKRIFKKGDSDRAYALDTLEIDCRQNLYRFTDIVIFDRDDLVSYRYALTDQHCPVPPRSYIHEIQDLVCAEPSPPGFTAAKPLPPWSRDR